MALDNYDRIKAVNAVVEAWTRRGSCRFIIYKNDLAAGSSLVIDVSDPWDGELKVFGTGSNQMGGRVFHYAGGTNTANYYGNPSGISYSYTGNRYTFTNNGSTSADVYVISWRGSAEEV